MIQLSSPLLSIFISYLVELKLTRRKEEGSGKGWREGKRRSEWFIIHQSIVIINQPFWLVIAFPVRFRGDSKFWFIDKPVVPLFLLFYCFFFFFFFLQLCSYVHTLTYIICTWSLKWKGKPSLTKLVSSSRVGRSAFGPELKNLFCPPAFRKKFSKKISRNSFHDSFISYFHDKS